ncbi:MAG: flippase [Candidatus Aminicenantes bacterium]|jgi:O-antigen/teichoic acid export membrane protein
MAKSFNTVIKNIFSLISAQIITRFIGIIFVAFLARYLGVEDFGRYTTILAFAAMAEIFVRIGIMKIMERDVAQDKSKASLYFSTATYILLITSIVGWSGMVLVSVLLGYSSVMIKLIALIGLTLMFQGIQGTAGSILRAFERMEILGAILVFTAVAKCVAGIILLRMGYGLITMILLIVAFHVFSTALYFIALHKKFIRLSWAFDSQLSRSLVKEGSLIFIMNALTILGGKVDIIILSKMKGALAVGIFGVAKRTIEYLRIFREGATGAIFPRMSAIQSRSPTSLGEVFGKVIGLFILIYFPVAVFLSFFSREIIHVVFGDEYVAGSAALVIMSWALLINVLGGPAAMIVIITKKKLAKFVPFVLFITVFQILMNFLLIPRYSYVGASIAFLITAVVGLIIRLLFVHSLLEKRPNLLEIVYRPALASLLMGAMLMFTSALNFILRGVIACSIYLCVLFVLGEFKKGEYVELKNLVRGFIKRETDVIE